MASIDEWLHSGTSALAQAGIDSARLDCLILLEHVTQHPREWLLAHGDTRLKERVNQLDKMLDQRKNHTPLAYIIGTKDFYGRTFAVTKDTLIPRPASEEVITQLLDLPLAKDLDEVILDIGTGSGVLAITAKLELPNANIIATDISDEALKVAKENASSHQAQVQFYRADLLNHSSAIRPTVILANLPYVPNKLITSDEIKNEPKIALFSGDDGLGHYKKFWKQLITYDPKPRYIITESLVNQHADLGKLAIDAKYKLLHTKQLIQVFETN